MDRFEKLEPLTTQDLHILNKEKGRDFTILLGLTFALIFGLGFIYLLYLNDPSFWILPACFAIILSSFCLFFMYASISRRIKINREVKGGAKKIIEGELEDYEESQVYHHNSSGGYPLASFFYFTLKGREYRVLRKDFYSFLNGDTVRLSVSPKLNIVLSIEKIADSPKSRIDKSDSKFSK